MTYCTMCDWCGRYIDPTDDYAEMPVTIHHRGGKSALDAKWAEETKPTRFFCAAPKEDTDQGGRDRAGLVPDETPDSCYDRAIAAITGVELSDPGMGLEWRLMPVGDLKSTAEVAAAPAADVDQDDTWIGELELGVRAYNILHRNGIDTIGQINPAYLHELHGMGSKTIREIEAALEKYRAQVRKQAA